MEDLDAVYRAHAATVYRFLLAKCGSDQMAEELTQETFYQAVRSIGRFDGSCQISTWLCGIGRNVLNNHCRKSGKGPVSLESVPEPTSLSAEEDVLSGMGREEILTAIHRLPEPGREVLYLRLLGTLSFRQIGAILGKTDTWARVTYYRAKLQVMKELSDQ